MIKRRTIIYKIRCLINGKIYIGRTSGPLELRWSVHRNAIRLPSLMNNPLYSDMRKFGVNNFIIEELESYDSRTGDKKISIMEKYWMYKLNTLSPNGYNIQKYGTTVLSIIKQLIKTATS